MREGVLNYGGMGVKLRRCLQILKRYFFFVVRCGVGGCVVPKNNGGRDKICMYTVLHVCEVHVYSLSLRQ
jgi:hypothetical protein